MHHRTVAECMTREVVRARPDMRFKEIVELLADNHVTAVPVVDASDRPMGVVSEADLLRKSTARDDPPGPSPVPDPQAWDRAKAEGVRAEELMSAPAVCVRPDWTVAGTARLMAVHDIKRLPVVDEEDRLQGIVSRSDLLRVFLRGDDAIRNEIDQDILWQTLRLAPSEVTVEVHEGQVTLGGTVEFKGQIPIVERLCHSVDGVVSVHEHIAYRTDDTHGSSDGM
ncbi:CBS domain-containing protein [Embleya sp. NPDC059259]|uniref:CBS domain-containing protein n=1 Tax=unclassified Embleya TaxID=2699296 RepID=UPI0036A9D980